MSTSAGVGKIFWRSFVVSLIGLLIATFTGLPELAIFGLGCAPLVYYHWRLSKLLREQAVPQVTIDTIYYFGFLVTISTLAATVIKVALTDLGELQSGEKLKHFAAIFGLGLVATGYALFARIQLMTQTERIEEEDLGDKVDRYAGEAQKALDVMMRSAAEFEAFADTVRQAAQQAVAQSTEIAQQALRDSAKAMVEQMTRSTSDISLASTDLAESIRGTNIKEDMKEFKERVRSVSGGITAAGNQITRLGAKMETTEQTIETLKTSLGSMSTEATKVSGSMRTIVEFGTPLADLRLSVASLGTQLRALTTESEVTKNGLSGFGLSLSKEFELIQSAVTAQRRACEAHIVVLGQAQQAMATLGASQKRQCDDSIVVMQALGESVITTQKHMIGLSDSADALRQRMIAVHSALGQNGVRLTQAMEQTRQEADRLRLQMSSALPPLEPTDPFKA